MTKADIAGRIQDATGLSLKESAHLLESLLSIMKTTLENGNNLKISGFGNFELRQKNDRIGRNPLTGESVTITARRVLTFKPSPVLKSAIQVAK